MTIPGAAASSWIVKLIGHAISTDAAHGCLTLLKSEETAICTAAEATHGCPTLLKSSETAVCAIATIVGILRAPWIGIVGKRADRRLRSKQAAYTDCGNV
jgi:hypothetical protein